MVNPTCLQGFSHWTDMKHVALRRLWLVFVLCGMCLTCSWFIRVYDGKNLMQWTKRQIALQLFSPVKMRQIYNSKCLVQNEFVGKDSDSLDTCGLCESFSYVTRLNENSEFVERGQNLMKQDIPYIYHDETWVHDSGTKLEDFIRSFLANDDLYWFEPCQYNSNRKVRDSLHQLLSSLLTGDVSSAYGVWENCARAAAKAFRDLYRRPAIVGHNVQITGTNWAMICRNYTGSRFTTIDIDAPVSVVMVQQGGLVGLLEPRDHCHDICSSLPIELQPGDLVVYAPEVYQLYLRTSCPSSETIVIGLGVAIDN